MLQKYLHKQIYFVSGCKLRERHNAGNTKSNKNARRNKHPRSLPPDGNGALQESPAGTSHRGYSLYYE